MKTVFSFAALCLVYLGCGTPEDAPPPETHPVSETTSYLNLGPDADYVGKDACKTCHADIYETYTASQMGRSFKPATRSASAARWDGIRPVYDTFNDLHYLPYSQGEALFLMEYRLAGRDTVFKRIERIDYIVGSGQHTNSHIMEENGFLYQMPLTWYAQDGKWSLPPKFARDNNYRFGRPISSQCMACHNALPDFVPGSENKFSRVPDGIDCERCHGPGSIHVEQKQTGKLVDITKEIDYTIVNPRKLPVDLQLDVCKRCHMQGAAVYRDGQKPEDFRPGTALEANQNVFWSRAADSARHFIMASHPDRLEMSPCFIQTHKPENREAQNPAYAPITCITCHNPHLDVKAKGTEGYNQDCQNCHAGNDAPPGSLACTESEPVRARQANNCVGCHMPMSGSTDIPYVKITDHYIRVPQPLGAQAADFVRLVSFIEKNPTDKDLADGFLTYFEEITNQPGFLDSAKVYLEKAGKNMTQDELAASLIRLWSLQEDYPAITRFAGTAQTAIARDAWSLYRTGEAFAKQGMNKEAINYYNQAVTLAPDHLRFRLKQATAYSNDGQFDIALSFFDTPHP